MKNNGHAQQISDDTLVTFSREEPKVFSKPQPSPWKIMIVDDDEGIHAITRKVLEDFSFERRRLRYLSAYSGKQAIQIFKEHPDVALILLDVVMETDHAGLDVVRFIREQLHNTSVRIILYTGQPGLAPEQSIITNYDINDYKVKSMLTSQSLLTAVISAIRTYRDLHVIKQQRDKLQKTMEDAQIAQKARYQFLANIGHELRTPLNHIIGFAEILLNSPLTERQRNYIQNIRKAGNDLCAVLNNVLELSELTEGRLVLKPSLFSLRKTIAEMMTFLDIQAQWKNLQTSYAISDDVPDMILGDSVRLKQVIVNVVGNAIKYTQRGRVHLEVTPFQGHPSQLLFTVSDTGIGISQDKHDHIFQPFALAEDALQKEFSGAGLGLTISKQIIEKMNGKIWIESTPGQGSTFYFSMEYQIG